MHMCVNVAFHYTSACREYCALVQGANQAAAAAKLQYPTYMLGQASPLVLP